MQRVPARLVPEKLHGSPDGRSASMLGFEFVPYSKRAYKLFELKTSTTPSSSKPVTHLECCQKRNLKKLGFVAIQNVGGFLVFDTVFAALVGWSVEKISAFFLLKNSKKVGYLPLRLTRVFLSPDLDCSAACSCFRCCMWRIWWLLVRRSSRPCVRRWAEGDRRAILHQ